MRAERARKATLRRAGRDRGRREAGLAARPRSARSGRTTRLLPAAARMTRRRQRRTTAGRPRSPRRRRRSCACWRDVDALKGVSDVRTDARAPPGGRDDAPIHGRPGERARAVRPAPRPGRPRRAQRRSPSGTQGALLGWLQRQVKATELTNEPHGPWYLFDRWPPSRRQRVSARGPCPSSAGT